uniref:F-box domain-containing protein n=1 Tax=Ditylenchus dipsaci TaxID=166011 RepID=A0A915CTJ6_9BILA
MLLLPAEVFCEVVQYFEISDCLEFLCLSKHCSQNVFAQQEIDLKNFKHYSGDGYVHTQSLEDIAAAQSFVAEAERLVRSSELKESIKLYDQAIKLVPRPLYLCRRMVFSSKLKFVHKKAAKGYREIAAMYKSAENFSYDVAQIYSKAENDRKQKAKAYQKSGKTENQSMR